MKTCDLLVLQLSCLLHHSIDMISKPWAKLKLNENLLFNVATKIFFQIPLHVGAGHKIPTTVRELQKWIFYFYDFF